MIVEFSENLWWIMLVDLGNLAIGVNVSCKRAPPSEHCYKCTNLQRHRSTSAHFIKPMLLQKIRSSLYSKWVCLEKLKYTIDFCCMFWDVTYNILKFRLRHNRGVNDAWHWTRLFKSTHESKVTTQPFIVKVLSKRTRWWFPKLVEWANYYHTLITW
jgi:hypothetical protein